MSFAEYLFNMVGIVAKYAVKEHYTDNGADYEQLEEIKRIAKNLSKYSQDYEVVYRHAEELQRYIKRKLERSNNGMYKRIL